MYCVPLRYLLLRLSMLRLSYWFCQVISSSTQIIFKKTSSGVQGWWNMIVVLRFRKPARQIRSLINRPTIALHGYEISMITRNTQVHNMKVYLCHFQCHNLGKCNVLQIQLHKLLYSKLKLKWNSNSVEGCIDRKNWKSWRVTIKDRLELFILWNKFQHEQVTRKGQS